MKRLFLLLAAALLVFGSANAQKDFTTGQKELRSELFNFLRGSGYAPSIDSDGDIAFEANGSHHWIIISATDTDPYYATGMRGPHFVQPSNSVRVSHPSDALPT